MGVFSSIGGVLGGPVGAGLGGVADIGLGFLGGGREKRAIEDAKRAQNLQFQEGINQNEDLRSRLTASTEPFTGAGTRATSKLEGLIFGDERLTPTAAEDFATDRALTGIDRASAANKQLMSGRRVEDLAQKSAEIGSQFRQQDINNLQNLSGQGLQATGLQVAGDANVTNQQTRLRELLGGSNAAATIGKGGVDASNIANVSSNLGNFLSGFKPIAGGGGNPNPMSSAVLGGGIFS